LLLTEHLSSRALFLRQNERRKSCFKANKRKTHEANHSECSQLWSIWGMKKVMWKLIWFINIIPSSSLVLSRHFLFPYLQPLVYADVQNVQNNFYYIQTPTNLNSVKVLPQLTDFENLPFCMEKRKIVANALLTVPKVFKSWFHAKNQSYNS
jgi:hypothetical protein